MTAPLSDERLAEIRRSVTEVSDYVADGLMPFRREHRDRADLLAEVDRLRADLARARAMLADARDRCNEAETKVHQVAMTKVWTNEDGKKFVFAEDLLAAVGMAAPASSGSPS